MSSQIIYVDVGRIHANKYNPNVMNPEKFEALVDFCRTHDADKLDPIWLRNDGVGKYEVIDGEHRWKAVKEVGWKSLRAFIIDMEEDDAKAFNVRKNRERGKIDGFKLGHIFKGERERGMTIAKIAKNYGYLQKNGSCGWISQLIEGAEREIELRERLGVDKSTFVGIRRVMTTVRELKREERGETPKGPTLETEESHQLEKFLTRYAKALPKNPLPTIQKSEVQTAIEFFKRLLENKQIHCQICGEKHLQWSCGHEF